MTEVKATVRELSEDIGMSVSGPETVRMTIASGTSITTNSDYEALLNKPQIESVTLEGNKSFDDLGLSSLTNSEILAALS